MKLEDLGYTERLQVYREEHGLGSYGVGRVISEHKDRYVVRTEEEEFDSELIGNLRYTAESEHDFPSVGDWVAVSEYDSGKALIHAIYPRHSIIERRAVGLHGKTQVIATNIDYGLIVLAVNRDFNINRLERYVTICTAANVDPVIILSKIDLIDEAELESNLHHIAERMNDVPIIPMSNQSHIGLEKVSTIVQAGKTYCLLGSSGVGKSTLLNNLAGTEQMQTGDISESIQRGKHVTSHRELIVLERGGIIIDNPGMREVGIADSSGGLEETFDRIAELAEDCKFKDCKHIKEKGCAVLQAVEDGELDKDAYKNFHKLQREKAHFESSVMEKRKKGKDLAKLYRSVQKERQRNKY